MKLTKKYIRLMIDEYYAKREPSIIGTSNNDVFNELLFFLNNTLAEMPDEYELSYQNIIDILYIVSPKPSDNLNDIYEIKQKLFKDIQLHLAEMSSVEVSTLDKFFINRKEVIYLVSSINYLEKANLIDSKKENIKKLLTLFDYNLNICNALLQFSRNNILDQTKLDFIYNNVAVIKSFYQGFDLLAQIIKKLEQANIHSRLDHINDLKTKEKLLWENPAHADKLAAAFVALTLCQLSSDIEAQFYAAFIKYPEVSHLLALSLCLLRSMEIGESLLNRLEQLLNNIQYIPIITHTLLNLNLKLQELRKYSILTYEEFNLHIEFKLGEIFSNPRVLLQHIESPTKFLFAEHKKIIDKIFNVGQLPFSDINLSSAVKKLYVADMSTLFEAKKVFKVLLILSKKLADSGEELLSSLPVEVLSKIALISYEGHSSCQALTNNLHFLYEQTIKAKTVNVQLESNKPQTEFFKPKNQEMETRLESEQASLPSEEKNLNEEQTVGTNFKK